MKRIYHDVQLVLDCIAAGGSACDVVLRSDAVTQSTAFFISASWLQAFRGQSLILPSVRHSER